MDTPNQENIALPQNQPIVPEQQSIIPQPRNNFLVVLLSVLLFLSVSIAGFFAYQTQMLVKELTSMKSTSTPVSTQESIVDPTADWKTYTNENFSFKYPLSVTVNYKTQGREEIFEIIGLDKDIALVVDPIEEHNFYLDKKVSKQIKYNNVLWNLLQGDKQYCDAGECMKISDALQVEHNGKRYTIVLDDLSHSDSMLNQILSTFKFVDSDLTSIWKAYTDSKQRFSIKYPSTWRIISGDFFGTGPKEIGEDILWAVNTFDINTNSMAKVIDDLGKQFPDRIQTINKIKVGGLNASQVITTTPTVADWYLETIIFEDADTIFTVSNGAIKDSNLQKMVGVPSGTVFKDFYSSFVLVN